MHPEHWLTASLSLLKRCLLCPAKPLQYQAFREFWFVRLLFLIALLLQYTQEESPDWVLLRIYCETSQIIDYSGSRGRPTGTLTQVNPYHAQACLTHKIQFDWLLCALCTVLVHEILPWPWHIWTRCPSARYGNSCTGTNTGTQCGYDL